LSLQIINAQSGYIRNGSFRAYSKSSSEITDRAKRYRANQHAPEQKHCFACGAKNPRTVHHINGDESDFSAKNLTRACQSCNVRIANVMRKAGLGVKTRQYNPKKKAGKRSSFGTYKYAVSVAGGQLAGDVDEAYKIIYETPPATRTEYAKRIYELRQERYGPTGRQDSLPF